MNQATNRLDRKQRLERVAEFRLRQFPVRAIAIELKVSHTTIVKDLKIIEQQWLEASADVIGRAKGREVARLELTIREAWEAWERSKQPHVKIVDRKDRPEVGPNSSTKTAPDLASESEPLEVSQELVLISSTSTTTHTAGDPRFLDLVITASSQIAQILGLNSAAELKITIERYIAQAAAELGVSETLIQKEIDDVAADAYQKAWGPEALR